MLLMAAMMYILVLADASTEGTAFSKSYLILNDSSTGSLKTISQNSLYYMPGLYVKGYGEAELTAKSQDRNLMVLEQTIKFTTLSNQYVGVISSHVKGRNLSELNVSLLGITSTGILKEENLSQVKSESSGLGLGYPGEGEYIFFLTGGHFLKLDFDDLPNTYTKTLHPYEFSFAGDELMLDDPASYIDQKVDLICSVSPDYQSSYSGYMLSRSVEDNGIRCKSEMEYGVVSE